MINIKLEKKDLWLLAAVMVFVVAVGYVIAYGGSQPADMGHSFGELEGVQRAITGSCSGQVMVGVNAAGNVVCEADDGTGDITGVYPGAGLTGGGSTGEVTLSLVPPVGFTVCTSGNAADCNGAPKYWTGSMCCVSGYPTCTTGNTANCNGAPKYWTGTMCCVTGEAVCTTGNAANCNGAPKYWTGTMCCVTGVSVCTTGNAANCNGAPKYWTGSMCCVE